MRGQLFLLRHGITRDGEMNINGAQTDTPLSEKGLFQAQNLIPLLSSYTFDSVIVSPLQRTRQTVQPYLSSLKKAPLVKIEPLIIERDLGQLTNSIMGDGQIPTSIAISGKNPIEWTPPNGESLVDVYQRAVKFYKKIRVYSGKCILICSHQSFLRCFELVLIGKDIDEKSYNLIPKMDFAELKQTTYS